MTIAHSNKTPLKADCHRPLPHGKQNKVRSEDRGSAATASNASGRSEHGYVLYTRGLQHMSVAQINRQRHGDTINLTALRQIRIVSGLRREIFWVLREVKYQPGPTAR